MAKILVVDDEMGIRELLSEILDDEGHETVLAENAIAARRMYAQHPLDLVLLDIWMPDTDGMSLLREWVQADGLKCPVVMMSGHASIETAIEAQTVGAVGFLEKPITLQKLLSTVHKVLSRSAARNASQWPSTLIPGMPGDSAIAVAAGQPDAPHFPLAPALSSWHQTLSQTFLDTGLKEFREATERVYFEYLIERERGSMTRVSESAGLERTHLYRKLKQLNIDYKRKAK